MIRKLKAKSKIKRIDVAGIHNTRFINIIEIKIHKENTFTVETIQPLSLLFLPTIVTSINYGNFLCSLLVLNSFRY